MGVSSLRKECVAEIACRTTGKYGSGYLIGPDLILTACHVLCDISKNLPSGIEIEVRLLEDPKKAVSWRSAVLAWPKPENWPRQSELDTPLRTIEPDDYTRSIARRIPLGWGNIPIDIEIPVTGVGFPRFKQKNNIRDTQQIFGDIEPLTAVQSKMFEIVYKAARSQGPQEGWKGISGAALFAQDRLIGVVRLKVETGNVDFKAGRLEESLKDPEFESLVTKYTAADIEIVGELAQVLEQTSAASPRPSSSPCDSNRDVTNQQVESWLKQVQVPADIELCKLPELQMCLWQDFGEWVDKRVRVWVPKIDHFPTFKDDLEDALGGALPFSIEQLKKAVRKITDRAAGGLNG